jgi:putative hydrolase of the HAD superfamily
MPAQRPTFLLCDVGGVLLRPASGAPDPLAPWEARLSLASGTLRREVLASTDAAEALVGAIDEATLFERAAARFGLPAAEAAALQADFWSGHGVDAAMADFLRALRCPTALLSNAWSAARQDFSQRHGLDQLSDTMLISAELGLAKPDPEIFRVAAAKLGQRPEDGLFIDDSPAYADGARRAGLRAIVHRDAGITIAAARALLT